MLWNSAGVFLVAHALNKYTPTKSSQVLTTEYIEFCH